MPGQKNFSFLFLLLSAYVLVSLSLLPSTKAASATSGNPNPQTRLISLEDLRQMAQHAKDRLWRQAQDENRDVKIYLHWTEKHYGQFFSTYHINIDADGSLYASTDELSEIKGHTYMRNTGSIGIALTCGERAVFSNLGKEPPTDKQIESMSKAIAILAATLSIPIDKDHIMTHGEAGDNIDRIFPPYANNGYPYGMYGQNHSRERWDLAILKNGDPWGSGGDILRAKARRYLKKLQE